LIVCEEKKDEEIKFECEGEEKEKKRKRECTYRKEKREKVNRECKEECFNSRFILPTCSLKKKYSMTPY